MEGVVHRHTLANLKKKSSVNLKENLERINDYMEKEVSPELLPHFQRTHVTLIDQIPTEDTNTAFTDLATCLEMRKDYMLRSGQDFPNLITQFLESKDSSKTLDIIKKEIAIRNERYKQHTPVKRRELQPHIENPWDIELKPNLSYTCTLRKGIVYIFDETGKQLDYDYLSFEQHVSDLQSLYKIVCSGPVRSFASKRISFLRSKFEMHVNLNEAFELADMARVPRRDFHNILKVDTHIHAAACMTPPCLLDRIGKAYAEEPDQEVLKGKNKEDPPITLSQLFKNLNLDPLNLSLDALDVHADKSTMNRFDRFDNLYNVAGQADLRKVFLKPTKNLIRGRYFADMIKEIFTVAENSTYVYKELRISGGSTMKEWQELGTWAKEFNVYSDNNRWVIQIPRCYAEKRKGNQVANFQELMAQTFLPMFLATSDPESYPEVATFLEYVIALDSVSDESVQEIPLLSNDLPSADEWTSEENPPYAYYLYYMFANLNVLNQFRKSRGMNIFKLRPHCGESGSVVHLASGFLLAENISHGIQLTQNPSMEYLYYLAQIPIAMSPLSNNALFLPYVQHPLKHFLAEGIPITVSTDDPLMFHLTTQPLSEEYAVAAQVFGLSACDQCELARNSVLMCGFPDHVKAYWLGENFREPGIGGNDSGFTNVPDVRVAYRFETHLTELYNLYLGGQKSQAQ